MPLQLHRSLALFIHLYQLRCRVLEHASQRASSIRHHCSITPSSTHSADTSSPISLLAFRTFVDPKLQPSLRGGIHLHCHIGLVQPPLVRPLCSPFLLKFLRVIQSQSKGATSTSFFEPGPHYRLDDSNLDPSIVRFRHDSSSSTRHRNEEAVSPCRLKGLPDDRSQSGGL